MDVRCIQLAQFKLYCDAVVRKSDKPQCLSAGDSRFWHSCLVCMLLRVGQAEAWV
jgi:hypothetical protein